MIYGVALVVFIIVFYLLHRRFDTRFKDVERMFPGPTHVPIVGNALIAVGRDFDGILMVLKDQLKQHCRSIRLWLGPKLFIVISDSKDVEALLSNSGAIEKGDLYKFLKPGVGDGLLISAGDKWRRHRKMLNPAFSLANLKRFIPIFNANCDILIDKLRQHVDQEPFDVYPFIYMFVLDNIVEAATGTAINAQNDARSDLLGAVHDEGTAVVRRITSFWLHPDFIFNSLPIGAISRNARRIVNNFLYGVIDQEKANFKNRMEQKSNHSVEDADADIGKERKSNLSFLQILLEASAEHKLSDKDIRDELATILAGGHDTMSSLLSFSHYSIAQHPNVQMKVMEEQDYIFQGDSRQPTYDDLQNMKYLEQVIKETLRHYPSIPHIGRAIQEDLPLGDGRYLPKGCNAIIQILGVHKNPLYWDSPDTFNPDNFTPEAIKERHPFAFLPFGGGPRNCIGIKFAWLEMKALLCSVLRAYEVFPSPRPEDKIVVSADIVLTSKTGLHICIKARKPNRIKSAEFI